MLKTVSAIATQVISTITGGLVQFTGPADGTTRVITVPNTNATMARTDAAQSFTGDQTLGTGSLIQGTAAKGFNFTANTPLAGVTSRLLNWYEEGTFTPTFTNLTVVNGSGGATYTGTYTRVGRLVYFTVRIAITGSCTTASTNGSTYVSLPFTAAPSAGSVGVADGNAANLSNGLISGAVCYMPTWSARNVEIYIGGTFSV